AASERSSRRSLTRSMTVPGSTFMAAAIRTGSCCAQSWVRAMTPDRPATIASQVDATSPPSGVVAPSPVTTTSRRDTSGRGLLDVGHRIAHGLQVLYLVVRDLHAELLLGGDDDLDHGQRVDVQVVGERLALGDVVRAHAGHLFEERGEVPGRDAGRRAGPFGQGRQRERGPAEHGLAALLNVRALAVDGDDVALVRRGAPHHRADAGFLVVGDPGHHGRSGRVPEQY